MDLRSIFIANGVGIFILLMLRYAASTRILRRRTEDKLFSFMIYGVMVACFMEAFSYAIDGHVFPGAILLNYIANTYLYSINMLLPFSVLAYVEIGLNGDPERIWKYYKPHIFIGVFMFLMNIVNFFIPISYVISDQNVYSRRPFSYVYYVVILFYCITAMLVTNKYRKETGAKPFLNIQVFLLPILIGAGLQFAFYGLSLAWLSAAIGLTGLFMMQQNELAYVDALVDTYNRQYMNTITSSWINRGRPFAGVMIDVDRFKDVNDTFGHSAGDRMLKDVTDILKSARLGSELVFRFAGDEFIVLRLTDEEDGLNEYMRRVNKLLTSYNEEHFGAGAPGHALSSGQGAAAPERGIPDTAAAGETAQTSADAESAAQSGPSAGNVSAAPSGPKKAPIRLALSYGTGYYDGGSFDDFLKVMDDRMYAMKAEHHSGDRRRKTDR